jgi:hypothetical protein
LGIEEETRTGGDVGTGLTHNTVVLGFVLCGGVIFEVLRMFF